MLNSNSLQLVKQITGHRSLRRPNCCYYGSASDVDAVVDTVENDPGGVNYEVVDVFVPLCNPVVVEAGDGVVNDDLAVSLARGSQLVNRVSLTLLHELLERHAEDVHLLLHSVRH